VTLSLFTRGREDGMPSHHGRGECAKGEGEDGERLKGFNCGGGEEVAAGHELAHEREPRGLPTETGTGNSSTRERAQYCAVFHCSVLYCIVLYSTALYCLIASSDL